MTVLALAALLAAAPAAAAPAAAEPAAPVYNELPPGRYSMAVTGLVSTVCSRAIAAEWSRLPEVEKAAVDFDAETAVILVRLNKTLRVAALRKALRRAEKLARLDGRYDFKDIVYKP